MRAKAFASLFVAAALLGCTTALRTMRPETVTDQTQRLRITSKKLARVAPAPALRIPLHVASVDELSALPGERILAGLTEISGIGGGLSFPNFGPYVAYDAKDGHELWRFGRSGTYDNDAWSVRATEPVVLLEETSPKTTRYHALDPATGKTLWSEKVGDQVRTTMSLDRLVFVVADASGGVSARDTRLGKVLWDVRVKDAGAEAPVLQTAGDELLVWGGSSLSSYRLNDGTPVFKDAAVGPPSRAVPVFLSAKGLLVPSADGHVRMLDRKGSIVWTLAVQGAPRGLACGAETCVFEETGNSTTGSLLASFQISNGQRLWEHPISTWVFSTLALTGSKVFFTLGNTLELWDAASGKPLHSVPFEAGGLVRLPDHLWLAGDSVVVATETSVQAFSVSELSPAWHYGIAPTFTSGSLARGSTAPAATGAVRPASGFPSQTTPSDSLRWAEQNRANVYAMTASASRSSNAADRLDASTDRYMAAESLSITRQMDASWGQSMANVSMMQASLNFMMSAQRMGEQIAAQGLARADALFVRAALPQSMKDQQNVLHGRFFIRPIIATGGNAGATGLHVIDLPTGGWIDLPTSPMVLQTFRRFTQVAISGDRVFTNGPGTDNSTWELDKNSALETLVYPSVLAFDLRSLPLKKAGEAQSDSLAGALAPAL